MPPTRRANPRKQPQQERSIATVDAILSATAQVLSKNGYERTTTQQIALKAGVSVGSLYQYYPSKTALVDALVEREGNKMIQQLEALIPELLAAPIVVAAHRIVRLLFDSYAASFELWQAVLQIPRAGRRANVRSFQKRSSDLIRLYLEGRRDELRVANLDAAVFLLMTLLDGVSLASVEQHPEYLKDPTFEAEVVSMALRYLLR